jgi:hypothetical protein
MRIIILMIQHICNPSVTVGAAKEKINWILLLGIFMYKRIVFHKTLIPKNTQVEIKTSVILKYGAFLQDSAILRLTSNCC